MTQVIKVFTPIKRVPTMVGKAQNGQKLPFGPYTLPQIGAGVVLMLITSVSAMSIPGNPAVTFIIGLILTVIVVFALGLVPYTGVRLTSRVLWLGRLLVFRKPVSASGMPINAESARYTVYIEDSVVVVFPDPAALASARSKPSASGAGILELAAGRSSQDNLERQ
ncbi:hypothetical protein [Nocardia uniformis]|uniref:hypothetical protein n=1 Tax=Nocardia uniformis TaxID=53432 RepID=UPI000A4BAC5E|nr:hypothetical protein [Nocardia uniformis]